MLGTKGDGSGSPSKATTSADCPLDFALAVSFRPKHNLCYSTLVNPADVANLDPAVYKKSDSPSLFAFDRQEGAFFPRFSGRFLLRVKEEPRRI
jgi:hypothetical protein